MSKIIKPRVRYAVGNELPMPEDSEDVAWLENGTLTQSFYRNKYKPQEVPRSVDVPIYINYGCGRYNQGRIILDDTGSQLKDESGDYAQVNLARLVLTVPLPEVEVESCMKKLVASLEAKKAKILAEAQAEAMKIQNEISNLLAITYQPEGGDDAA